MRFLKTTLAAAGLMAFATGAIANDANFKLKNKTGYHIDEVYVSPHSSDNWGSDIMGSGALDDGGNVNIVFPHGGTACRFDIKVKYNIDSTTAQWTDVDLCKYETISLFWDQKSQVTRAVGE